MIRKIVVLICIALIVIERSEAADSEFEVMLVSGHVSNPQNKPNTVGAISYSGIEEYRFNDSLLKLFELEKNQIEGVRYQLIFATENIELRERSNLANRRKPDLFIEIHHDSARESDRLKAGMAGLQSELWNRFKGFSVHYSTDSHSAEESKRFAVFLGDEMLNAGFQPNSYLSEIMGMQVIDSSIALYNRVRPHGLYVLRAISTPAALLEVGNIANPVEEEKVSSLAVKQRVVDTIKLAISRYLSEKAS